MRRASVSLLLVLGACSTDQAPDLPEPGTITSRPLPQRDAHDGTRFVERDAKTTGLEFSNLLRRENLLPYLYSGAGVAVGDYDGNGLPDVYLVSQDGPNKLFRQTAPWQFEDVTATAGPGLDGGEVWGASASFVDIDGDRDLDLYVCNTEAPNQLFQNRGDGTFQEVGGRFGLATTASSVAASFADYDNDGDLDLYLLTNRVYAPRLPQTLVNESTPPAGTQTPKNKLFPRYPNFDPDGDGTLEVPPGYEDFFTIYQGRVFVAGQRDRLFRNDGYAQWTDVTDKAGIRDQGLGLSVTWWDCDGDGNLDIYVANDLEAPDQLYRNRGDGTFEDITQAAVPHTAYFGMGADFGDIDNDGHFDFCVGDMSSTSHYMGKMLMGTMGDKRWFLMNAEPRQHMRNALYLNSGMGRFYEGAHLTGLASSDWTWAVRFVDLDEDGWLDFYATNGIPRFDDDPDAAAAFQTLWRSGAHEKAVDVYRKLDAVAERNIARRNVGRGLKFEDVSAAWGLDQQTVGQGTALVDLDRDGDLDILVNNLNQQASILENRSSGTHRIAVDVLGTRDNHRGLGCRLELVHEGVTQTRLVTTMRGYKGSEEATEFFGLGANTKTVESLTVTWPDGSTQRFEDLPVDHHFTVRQADTAPAPAPPRKETPDAAPPLFTQADTLADRKHRERDFDDYAIQPLLPHRLSRLGPGLATSDINGDGQDDIYLGGAAGQPGSLRMTTPEGWAEIDGPWLDDAECEDMGALFFDADVDGDLDLYVVSGGIEANSSGDSLRDRLYLQAEDKTFQRADATALPGLRHSGSSVAAGDLDRDGDLDLIIGTRALVGRYPESGPSVLLQNDGSGHFEDVTTTLAPELEDAGMVTGAVFGDIDGDGFLDLVLAAHWRPIQVFHNVEGPTPGSRRLVLTAATALDASPGLWNGVALADLDGDLDLDIIATNLGLNSKYQADATHPIQLFADDFDDNGQLDVIEAKSKGNQLLPVRGLSCSSAAMPFLRDKFPTFDGFAKASLPDIYGAETLQAASSREARELQHVVFENVGTGAGQWKPHPLPRLTQIAPAFGIALLDADTDGDFDIVLAQNFDSPEPETGRMAGGLGVLILNHGTMQFEALRPDRAGIFIPEDTKGLALAHAGGATHLIATTNNGPTRVFTHRSAGQSLRIHLHGGAGDPSGIGARVSLTSKSTSAETRLLDHGSSGSGYLSQSSATRLVSQCQAGDTVEVTWSDGSSTRAVVTSPTGDLHVTR